MVGREDMRRGRARAVAGRERVVPWWAWGLLAAGVAAAVPSWAQTAPGAGVVPEVVTPTLPRGNDPAVVPAPRVERPQVDGGGVRPVPDGGVLAPPVAGVGGSVIRPPAGGAMPVIPPSGVAK